MHKLHAPLAIAAVLALGACASDSVGPTSRLADGAGLAAAAAAGSGTVVVTEADIARQQEGTAPTRDWVYYYRVLATSLGTFRTGPGNPPSGVGSFEFSTSSSADKGTLFNFDHIGIRLATIDEMGYATFRSSGSAQQVAAINMQVYTTGAPGSFTTLVFEPVYNTSQGAVVSGEWQDWDAYDGGQAIWWSTRDLIDANGNVVACNPNGVLAATPVCAGRLFVPWSTIVAAFPNATISGGYGVNQGSGNPGLVTAVDVLTIGASGTTVTYDFEPYRVATTKGQCKDGGFKLVRRADGSTFKNQGDCVSYVQTGK